jgi:hypothetical protein
VYDRSTVEIFLVSLIGILYNKDVFDASVYSGLCDSSMRVDCTTHRHLLRHDN